MKISSAKDEENAPESSKVELIRHSAAHVLAEAVKELFPDVKLGIGPAIENGFYYDFDLKHTFTPEDLEKIEQRMKEIIKRNEKFERFESTKKKAEEILKDEPYKLELLKELDKPTFYKNGEFIDLCKGPHVNYTPAIKAFKLTKVSGAYWKGNSDNKQLQRIYGLAFKTKDELNNYLKLLEEAEKRNHLHLGKKLDLFSFHSEAPAMPFWHNNGMIIKNELIKFWRELHQQENYQEIETPIILDKELWLKSGHWDNYKENMYFTKVDNRDFAV